MVSRNTEFYKANFENYLCWRKYNHLIFPEKFKCLFHYVHVASMSINKNNDFDSAPKSKT